MQVKQIASGLAEPLGLKVLDDRIFVLQKQELTELIDRNGDEIIDEYRLVSNDWNVTDNFHEFAFGLLYEDDAFYAALASAILPGGAPAQRKRAIAANWCVMIPRPARRHRRARTAHAKRYRYGVDDELFIADIKATGYRQAKIVHVKEGAFYGFREVKPEADMKLHEDAARRMAAAR